jgi:hypothetical protein
MISRRYISTTEPDLAAQCAAEYETERLEREAFFAEWSPVVGVDGQTDSHVWRLLVPKDVALPEWVRAGSESRGDSVVVHPNKKVVMGRMLGAALDTRARHQHPLNRFASECGFQTSVYADNMRSHAGMAGAKRGELVVLSLPFGSPAKASEFTIPQRWVEIHAYEFEIVMSEVEAKQ